MSNTRTQTFAVNAANDMYVDEFGNLAIVYDLQAVLQICEHVAKTRLGEVALSVNEGIPYFQTVWNGMPNFQQFEAALRQAFFGVTGVIEVVSLGVSQTGNILNYTAVIRTVYGTGAISGRRL